MKAEIPKLQAAIETAGKQNQNSLWRYFGITTRPTQAQPSDATQAKLDLLTAEINSLREIIRANAEQPKPQSAPTSASVSARTAPDVAQQVPATTAVSAAGRAPQAAQESKTTAQVGQIARSGFPPSSDEIERLVAIVDPAFARSHILVFCDRGGYVWPYSTTAESSKLRRKLSAKLAERGCKLAKILPAQQMPSY